MAHGDEQSDIGIVEEAGICRRLRLLQSHLRRHVSAYGIEASQFLSGESGEQCRQDTNSVKDETQMNLGKVIRGYRETNNIVLRDMAKIVGTSTSTLSRIENGKQCDGTTLGRVLTWLLATPAARRAK